MGEKNASLWRGKYLFGLLLVTFFGIGLPVSAQTPPPEPPPLPEFPAPAITVSASPSTISNGQSSTISWSTDYTLSCSASGAWSGDKELSGSEIVTPSETGDYTLQCVGSFGGSDQKTVAVTVSPDLPDTTSPTKPQSFAGTVVSRSQINLSWAASTDPLVSGQVRSGVAEYRVERCRGTGCTNFVQVGILTNTTYSDTGLSANTRYRYRVRAADGAGNLSSYSSIIGKTTSR